MRCLACNKILSDYEATRKYSSGDFLDLCSTCNSYIDVDVVDRPDLCGEEDTTLENPLNEDDIIYILLGDDDEI